MKMRSHMNGIATTLGAFALLMFASLMSAPGAGAQAAGQSAAQGGQGANPGYTMPEYNAFHACQTETDPAAQVKCLDDFTARFPNSTLTQYVYALQYPAYAKLKNYAKEIEAADKLIAMDKADVAARLYAVQARLQAFTQVFDPKAADATAQLQKDRDAALLGPKLLNQVAKPAAATDEQWAQTKKAAIAFFDNQAGYTELQLHDYNAAIASFKDVLANTPNDATATYQIGSAYLAMTPPQTLDGFWAVARSISLKVPKADQVKDYLRSKMLAYEQPGCDSQIDAQLNELLQLAANSPDRPATYTIPSADDLRKIHDASNVLSIISDLQGGGDKAKMTWLAVCGAEFPEAGGKVIDVQNGTGTVDFLVNMGATSEDMQNATAANMDVKVYTAAPATPPPSPTGGSTPAQITPQPDVTRIQKDDAIKFSGTIVGYDPSPFLLKWDQVKVDPSSIPAAGAPKGRGGRAGRGRG